MSKTAWEIVQIARDIKRPTAQYFINNIFTDFVELHGDRLFADDSAVIGGIGRIGGMAVTVVGQEKGVNVSEKALRNFGSAYPEGYRKSLRLIRQAEKFGRPVVCIVDTQGAFCGVGAEERGMGEAIARNLLELSRVKVPLVGVLIGEGGSGGALALAVCDKLAMLENSIYSILSPEGFASILWKDSSRAEEAASLMRMTASEVHAMGIVNDVIEEPRGGAAADDGGRFAGAVGKYIEDALNNFSQKTTKQLLDDRYKKLRKFGRNYIAK